MIVGLGVFLACLAVFLWVYAGYPLLLLVISRFRRRPVARGAIRPRVSIVIAAHNEEPVIRRKLESCLAADYPPELLEVLVVSDGSTDATESIVRELARTGEDSRIRLLSLPRRGKAAALNAGAAAAGGEILVLTDANVLLQREALQALVAPFADPRVGGACGNKIYTRPGVDVADAVDSGENLYWRFDKALKRMESRIGSIFAADGALYAVRRELYAPIADPAQADDIAVSARIVLQGHRLVFVPEAVAVERPPVESGTEFRRKVRVTNRSVRALLLLGSGLWTRGFYSLELLSHKLLRHLVPFFLLGMLLASAWLATASHFFRIVLAAQIAFYSLAIVGHVLRRHAIGRHPVVLVPYFFSYVNLAALVGIAALLGGRRYAYWTPRQGA